jgi:hypothetical protein
MEHLRRILLGKLPYSFTVYDEWAGAERYRNAQEVKKRRRSRQERQLPVNAATGQARS